MLLKNVDNFDLNLVLDLSTSHPSLANLSDILFPTLHAMGLSIYPLRVVYADHQYSQCPFLVTNPNRLIYAVRANAI